MKKTINNNKKKINNDFTDDIKEENIIKYLRIKNENNSNLLRENPRISKLTFSDDYIFNKEIQSLPEVRKLSLGNNFNRLLENIKNVTHLMLGKKFCGEINCT